MIMDLGIDAGNFEIKIYGDKGAFKTLSTIGEFRERRLKNSFSDQDIVFEYKGRKGFAGTLAQYESEFAGSIVGTSKAHEDTVIRVLIGIAQYTKEGGTFRIIVGQPIEQHTTEEKQIIKDLLTGDHEITINDEIYKITIERVEVSAEGGVAFWSHPKKGLVRILDFGSGTVNGASLMDGKYIDRDSFTADFGLSTIRSNDKQAFMRAVFIQTQKLKWSKFDAVHLVGGAAEELLPYAKAFYEHVEVLRPKINNGNQIQMIHPVFANAVGMFALTKGLFK